MAEEKYRVGQRFNSWTLKKKLSAYNHNTMWLVICDCGMEVEINAANIYTGKSRSCGSCAAKKRWAEGRGPKR